MRSQKSTQTIQRSEVWKQKVKDGVQLLLEYENKF